MEGAGREKEPHLVLPDRPAERGFEIGQLLYPVRGLQPASLERVCEIVALEVLVLITGEEAAVEFVAAVSRNHVQPDAAARHVSGRATGGVDHFLAH